MIFLMEEEGKGQRSLLYLLLKNLKMTFHLCCHTGVEITEILVCASGEFLKSLHIENLAQCYLYLACDFFTELQHVRANSLDH